MIPYISVHCQIPVMGATNTGCAQETVAVIHHTFCKIFMHEICKHFPLREYRTQGSVNKRLLFYFLRVLVAWNAVAAHLLFWTLGQPIYVSICLSLWLPLRHHCSQLVWFSAVSTKQFFCWLTGTCISSPAQLCDELWNEP